MWPLVIAATAEIARVCPSSLGETAEDPVVRRARI